MGALGLSDVSRKHNTILYGVGFAPYIVKKSVNSLVVALAVLKQVFLLLSKFEIGFVNRE